MTVRNQTFTQRGYTSLSDIMQGGNLPLDQLLTSWRRTRMPGFGTWSRPRAAHGDAAGHRASGQPVRRAEPEPTGAGAVLPRLGRGHHIRRRPGEGGTTGSVTTPARRLVASRYALAALDALGRPVRGDAAGRTAVCLTGAYTRALARPEHRRHGRPGQLRALPGDVDEAVQELLDQDFAARDASGLAPGGDLGFERIEQFRAGTLGGPASCGI